MRSLTTLQRFLPVMLALAATTGLLQARNRKEILPEHPDLTSFPISIRQWEGIEIAFSPAELEVLGPGQFLSRDYRRSSVEPPVNLYIAFFPSQRTGDTIHSPKNCLPGSGWTPLESGYTTLRGDNFTISVNRYLVSKSAEQDLVFYWYQAHGRVTPSEYWAKVFLVTDAIRMNRSDGAMIRIVTPILRNDTAAAEARATEFTENLVPLLDAYIPK
jgi:EpsI family protein